MVRDVSTIGEIGAISMRDAGAVLREVGEGSIRDADSLETFFSPGGELAVDYPGEAYGAGASAVGIIVTTNSITVTVTGGKAPYTPLWTKVGTPDPDWIITAPNQLTTAFKRLSVPPATTYSDNFICTVTDARGDSVATLEVPATVSNYGGLEVPI
jgi:hypothetical protein